jgi:hypothetical protein
LLAAFYKTVDLNDVIAKARRMESIWNGRTVDVKPLGSKTKMKDAKTGEKRINL